MDMSQYQGLSSLGHEEIGNRLFDMLTSEGVFDIEEKKSLDTVSPEIDTNQPVNDSAISSDSDAKLEKK